MFKADTCKHILRDNAKFSILMVILMLRLQTIGVLKDLTFRHYINHLNRGKLCKVKGSLKRQAFLEESCSFRIRYFWLFLNYITHILSRSVTMLKILFERNISVSFIRCYFARGLLWCWLRDLHKICIRFKVYWMTSSNI